MFQPCLPGSFSPFLALLFSPIQDSPSPTDSAGLKAALSQRLGHSWSPSVLHSFVRRFCLVRTDFKIACDMEESQSLMVKMVQK